MVLHDRGIGVAGGAEGAEEPGARHHADDDGGGEEHVLPDGVRHEGNAVFVSELFVFLDVGGAANDAAGHGPVVDAELQDQEKMQADEREQQAGNQKHVEREEAREGCARDDGPAQQHVDGIPADERNATGDGSADAESPVGVLIEAQDLSGEGHAERHEQQEDADDPGEFARKFVGAEEEDLAQVDEHDGHHEVRAPAVHGAQEPSQGDAVVEELQAVPGFGGRRNIDQRQHDAGEDLENEERQRGAAEDVPPARRLARNGMRHRVADGAADLQPLLEPVCDGL